MRPHALLAYDADGNVVATLDHLVSRDDDGHVVGLVDFAAHEVAGGELTDIWRVEGAAGSGVWPEWLGARALQFRVELAGAPGRKAIAALVHRTSGHRRERVDIETAIAGSPVVGGARDVRHIVGGPNRALHLDAEGRTVARPRAGNAHLPRIGA